MGIKVKSSRTSGRMPNLSPGELGVNIADDTLLLRLDGRKFAAPLAGLRQGAPAEGPYGAPVVRTSSGAAWSGELGPSSVVNGAIDVDAPPPAGAYGVPGAFFAGAGDTLVLPVDGVIVETFYVASDQVHLTELAFAAKSLSTGAVRVGIADASGTILADAMLLTVSELNNQVAVDLMLARGTYFAIFWTAEALTLGSAFAFRPEQGLNFDGGGHPVFVRSQSGSADLSAGLDMSSLSLTQLALATPGEDHAIVMAWS